MRRHYFILTLLFMGIFLAACNKSSPISKLQSSMEQHPEYSIVLEDMKQDGNFFPEYYHRYKTIYGERESGNDSMVYRSEVSDWERVDKREYQKYDQYLGMTLASKSPDGDVDNNQYPPGYQYVGNPQYGEWRTNANGTSFWEFYGKYAMLQTVFGMFNRPVYRNDYDTYRNYRNQGKPYFGNKNQYGTYGNYTKKSNPTFFQRRQVRESQRKRSFSDKVKNRTRRSNMSRSRSRSGGFGK